MTRQTRDARARKPVAAARRKVHYPKEESAGFLIWDAARMLNRIFRGKVSWPELNNSHWPFVRELWEQDGISQRELADRARMRPPTCLAALRGLEMSKMVKRVPDKSDRRKINVFLTQKGRDMYHRVVPELKQIHDLATRGVSKQDLETLMSVLRQMRNNLAEHSRSVPRHAIAHSRRARATPFKSSLSRRRRPASDPS